MKTMILAALGLFGAGGAHAACPPSDGLHYICGPVGSEDLARAPGTPWLIASGIRTNVPGHLYRIDTRTGKAEALTIAIRPDPVLAKDCPAPLDPSQLSIDGIGLRGRRLYGANHGGRQAIEMFDLYRASGKPRLTWIGCAPTPKGTLANSVAPLPDGGIVITSFYDPRDKDAWARMGRGEPTGSLWEWHADRGFRRLDSGPISGANGLALSRDARNLYVSAWSGHTLLAIDRRTLHRRTIRLDFMPDNLKLAADGTLFVAGQATTVGSIAACTGPVCAQDWVVARVDPKRGTVNLLLSRKGNATVSYACGALEVGGTLYVTARADRRLVTMPMRDLPSLR